MFMRLNMFAILLDVNTNDLLEATFTDGLLEGYELPVHHQILGGAVMYDFEEAIAFAKHWHAREKGLNPAVPHEVLLSLGAVAELAGISPMVLWQAVYSGRIIKGVTIPAAVKSHSGQFMFEASAAESFAQAYRKVHGKN
jgi:hypothetical protein